METVDLNEARRRQVGVQAISLEDFLKMEIPPRELLLAPWLPAQGIAMIFAQRGIGKTHFSLSVAYAVATGGTFLGWEAPEPKRVLFIDGEMPAVAMQDRLASIIAGNEKTPPTDFLRLVTPDLQHHGVPDLSSSEGQEALEPLLAEIELVVLDNISTLFRSGVENDAESWGPVQAWVLSLRRRGISSMFVHHAGKGGEQRGTSRREDVLDTVIRLKRPSDYSTSDGARFEVHFDKARSLSGNEIHPIEAKLEMLDGVASWTTKALDDCLTERVAACLNGGLTVRDTATELGIGKSSVSRHKRRAKERGLLNEDIR